MRTGNVRSRLQTNKSNITYFESKMVSMMSKKKSESSMSSGPYNSRRIAKTKARDIYDTKLSPAPINLIIPKASMYEPPKRDKLH